MSRVTKRDFKDSSTSLAAVHAASAVTLSASMAAGPLERDTRAAPNKIGLDEWSDCVEKNNGYKTAFDQWIFICKDYPNIASRQDLSLRRANEIRSQVSALWPGDCRTLFIKGDGSGCSANSFSTCNFSDRTAIFKALHWECLNVNEPHEITMCDAANPGECKQLDASQRIPHPRSQLERGVMYDDHNVQDGEKQVMCRMCKCDELTGTIDCDEGLESMNNAVKSKCDQLGASLCPGELTEVDAFNHITGRDQDRFGFRFDSSEHQMMFAKQRAFWLEDGVKPPTLQPEEITFTRSEMFQVSELEPGIEHCWTDEPIEERYKRQFFRTCFQTKHGDIYDSFTDRRMEEIRAMLRQQTDDCFVYVHHVDDSYKSIFGTRFASAHLAPNNEMVYANTLELCEHPMSDASKRYFKETIERVFRSADVIVKRKKGKVFIGTCNFAGEDCRKLELRAHELYRTVRDKEVLYAGLEEEAVLSTEGMAVTSTDWSAVTGDSGVLPSSTDWSAVTGDNGVLSSDVEHDGADVEGTGTIFGFSLSSLPAIGVLAGCSVLGVLVLGSVSAAVFCVCRRHRRKRDADIELSEQRGAVDFDEDKIHRHEERVKFLQDKCI